MARPFYRVNGVDLLPYLADEGFEWEENDIDADGSGRTLDTMMHRFLLASKDKHTLKFRPLTLKESRIVTGALNSEYVDIQMNFHPKISGTVSKTLYNSSRKSAVFNLTEDDDSTWNMDPISLIEE